MRLAFFKEGATGPQRQTQMEGKSREDTEAEDGPGTGAMHPLSKERQGLPANTGSPKPRGRVHPGAA